MQIPENSELLLSPSDEAELEEALHAIERGEFTDGKALLEELRANARS